MKTFIYLIVTCLISTGAILSGLNQGTILTGYGIAISIWALFFWGWYRRSKN